MYYRSAEIPGARLSGWLNFKPNVCGSTVWNLIHVWFLGFWGGSDSGKFVAGFSMIAKIQTSFNENCLCSVCKKGLFKFRAYKDIVSAIHHRCFAFFHYSFVVKVQENQGGLELNWMPTNVWSVLIICRPKNILIIKNIQTVTCF